MNCAAERKTSSNSSNLASLRRKMKYPIWRFRLKPFRERNWSRKKPSSLRSISSKKKLTNKSKRYLPKSYRKHLQSFGRPHDDWRKMLSCVSPQVNSIVSWLPLAPKTISPLKAIPLSGKTTGLPREIALRGIWFITTCSWLVELRFTEAKWPKWPPVKVKPSLQLSQYFSMHWPEEVCMWLPSMTTSPSVTRNGWVRSMNSMVCLSTASISTNPTALRAATPTKLTSPSAPTTNSASITCAITWLSKQHNWFSESITSLLSMRLIACSSMKREHRSSYRVPLQKATIRSSMHWSRKCNYSWMLRKLRRPTFLHSQKRNWIRKPALLLKKMWPMVHLPFIELTEHCLKTRHSSNSSARKALNRNFSKQKGNTSKTISATCIKSMLNSSLLSMKKTIRLNLLKKEFNWSRVTWKTISSSLYLI